MRRWLIASIVILGGFAALGCPNAAAAAGVCPGDCSHDGAVTVDELIVGVNIALGEVSLSACPAFDVRADQAVTVDELLAAIDAALSGCAGSTPPLLSSDPPDGTREVPRTAWFRLEFTDAVDPTALRGFALSCNGATHGVALNSVFPDVVVANPAGELPGAASCTLSWSGPQGPQSLSFSTAASGPPATVFYDRVDRRPTVPFPDDFWTAEDTTTPTGIRVAMPVPVGPVDVMGIFRALLRETNTLDGFSPIAHFVLEVSDAPDPTSLPLTPAASLDPLASVGLFDLTPGSPEVGRRVPFRLQIRNDTNVGGVMSHALLLFPSIPLTPGGRYGLVLTRRALVSAGRPLDPSPFFQAVVAPAVAGESAAITRVRALADEVLETVATVATPPIPADDVALAVRISIRTTDDIVNDLRAIKDQVLAATAPSMAILSVEPDPSSEDVAAIVRGTWEAPDWRTGPAYQFFARDAQGRPMQTRTRAIPFTLALPKAALSGPVPITMYQHGNPGSAENEVPSSARRSLAGAGFAVIGFTDTLNRELSMGATTQPEAIAQQVGAVFFALVESKHVPDYWMETAAEQLAFLRLIQSLGSLDLLPIEAPDGKPDLDVAAPLTYLGISEGANNGPRLLPYAPEIRGAALVAGGARLAEVLIHQSAQSFLTTLGPVFPNMTPADIWVGLALFQTLYDRQDAHNHGRFIYRAPFAVAGTAQKASILQIEGLNDSLVPNHASESLAWGMGPIPHLKPVQRAVPFLNLIGGPVTANIDAHTTAAFFQYVPVGVPGIDPTPGCAALLATRPDIAQEGHYCAQSAQESFRQRVVFFQTTVRDAAPTIINPFAD